MKTRNVLLKTVCLLVLIVFSKSSSFGQSWGWGKAGNGSLKSNDYGSPVATDKNGNAYITGQYGNTVTFGSITLNGSGDNAYLVKYDPAGNVIWAVQPTDSSVNSVSFGTALALDKLGNIYVTGVFYNTIMFGTDTLRAINSYAMYLVKYDPSGNIVWAEQSVGTGNNYYIGRTSSVTTDENNNVLITGEFSDTAVFGTVRLISNSSYNVFTVKYDPSGNVLWANQASLPASSCAGSGASITTDGYGSVYVTGNFSVAIFFGAYHLISINYPSIFLVKYNANGALLWAKQDINSSISSEGEVTSSVTDRNNDTYLTGYFQDSIKFGSSQLYSPTESSAFIVKYDSGGEVLWAKQSSLGMQGGGLACDAENHIYFTAISTIHDTIFSFGGYALHTVAWANSNTMLFKCDNSGNALCGSLIQNLENYYYTDNASGVASDSTGDYVYMAGTFYDDTVFCGPDTLISSSGPGIFTGRWYPCGTPEGINGISNKSNTVSIYPNPNNGNFNIQCAGLTGGAFVEIYNMTGQKVYSHSPTGGSPFTIDLSNQPNGIYLYRVLKENGELMGEGKLIVQK